MGNNMYYQLMELGRIIGVYTTEDAAWEAAQKEFAVINCSHGMKELASGYKIEKVSV